MFIRKKKIKGILYAYKVVNIWQKKKKWPKQKVSEYLGKVLHFEKLNQKNFFNFFEITNINEYVQNHEFNDIIKDLVIYELNSCGFLKKNNMMTSNDVTFDLNNFIFKEKNKIKKLVIEMNEGILCKDSLDELLKFRYDEYLSSTENGYNLAKLLVNAGIKIEQELFIEIVKKFIPE